MARRAAQTWDVYCITNRKNGKQYVGAGRDWLKRWADHRSNAVCGSEHLLHCAIRKYGANAFEPKLLLTCDSRATAFEQEILYIRQLGTFAPMRKAFHRIRSVIKGWERARTARRIRMLAAAEALMADMPADWQKKAEHNILKPLRQRIATRNAATNPVQSPPSV